MEQESQKREMEDSVGQTPNGPILCANNCGFFGSASTNNLCSKCYRDFFLKQSKNAVVEKLEQSVVETVNQVIEEVNHQSDDVMPTEVGTTSEDPGKRPANRCNFCRKRVGLTGFKCRCGYSFCNLHRYSDKHNCSFDYKSAGQDAIAKANPVVKADKIEKI